MPNIKYSNVNLNPNINMNNINSNSNSNNLRGPNENINNNNIKNISSLIQIQDDYIVHSQSVKRFAPIIEIDLII